MTTLSLPFTTQSNGKNDSAFIISEHMNGIKKLNVLIHVTTLYNNVKNAIKERVGSR